jgi:hypothetical protein
MAWPPCVKGRCGGPLPFVAIPCGNMRNVAAPSAAGGQCRLPSDEYKFAFVIRRAVGRMYPGERGPCPHRPRDDLFNIRSWQDVVKGVASENHGRFGRRAPAIANSKVWQSTGDFAGIAGHDDWKDPVRCCQWTLGRCAWYDLPAVALPVLQNLGEFWHAGIRVEQREQQLTEVALVTKYQAM